MYTRLVLQTQLKANPELLLVNRILSLPAVELETFIAQEVDENPALEVVSPPHAYAASSQFAAGSIEFESLVERIESHEPALDRLQGQLNLLGDGPIHTLASQILQRLDARGYLDCTPVELATELGASYAELESARRLLHQLEPAGIGAYDLRECLLIQCGDVPHDGREPQLLRRMLQECWDDCVGHRWRKVARTLAVSPQDVEESWRYLRRHFYPHPFKLIADSNPQEELLTYPDLIIHYRAGACPPFRLEVPAARRFELRISASFERVAHVANATAVQELTPGEHTWITAWLERARSFIAAVNQRGTTLRRIGEAVIRRQEAFLEAGPRFLKPMTRAALASELGLHQSTISRAVSGKVIQLPDGRLRLLADLFDTSLAAKEAIRQLLAQSSCPLSDRELAASLLNEGLPVARRTVAKYRQQMRLNSSHERRSALS